MLQHALKLCENWRIIRHHVDCLKNSNFSLSHSKIELSLRTSAHTGVAIPQDFREIELVENVGFDRTPLIISSFYCDAPP